MLLPDITSYIDANYFPEQREEVLSLVASAVLHDGSAASPRCQRAALIGADGSLTMLRQLIEHLRVDYRDVILAGEYEQTASGPKRIRDLNQPLRQVQAVCRR
jgi:hypothetical protein